MKYVVSSLMDIPPPSSTHGFSRGEVVPTWLLESEPREGVQPTFGCRVRMTISPDGEMALLQPLEPGYTIVTLPDGEGYIGADGSPMNRPIRR